MTDESAGAPMQMCRHGTYWEYPCEHCIEETWGDLDTPELNERARNQKENG